MGLRLRLSLRRACVLCLFCFFVFGPLCVLWHRVPFKWGEPRQRKSEHHSLAVLVVDFEEWENQLVQTLLHAKRTIHSSAIVVDPSVASHVVVAAVSDEPPYPPPFGWRSSDIPEGVDVVINGPQIANGQYSNKIPSARSYLVLPDNAFIADAEALRMLITSTDPTKLYPNGQIILLPIEANPSMLSTHCSQATFDVKRWTLSLQNSEAWFTDTNSTVQGCNYFSGRAGLIVSTDHLDMFEWRRLGFRPAIKGLLLQALRKKVPVIVKNLSVLRNGPNSLYSTEHNNYKRIRNENARWSKLMLTLGIKLVSTKLQSDTVTLPDRKNSRASKVLSSEWFGCTKQTARCFGTIINDTASYLMSDRWTPPCCLKHLRTTTRYVVDVLDRSKARYWLEGGSLLGAARGGDIIPWDYDVDLGIHDEDVNMCKELAAAHRDGYFISADGYVWEKAREGNFFRVQFSQFNHLHVDIFPFFESGELMDRHGKMKTHKQDTSFPKKFLSPLARINFVDRNVSCPNKHKEFLEYKFGAGVIEHPKYPHDLSI